MMNLLAIEVEADENGWHAVIIDLGDDAVLYVSNSYASTLAAMTAAQNWIEKNQ